MDRLELLANAARDQAGAELRDTLRQLSLAEHAALADLLDRIGAENMLGSFIAELARYSVTHFMLEWKAERDGTTND